MNLRFAWIPALSAGMAWAATNDPARVWVTVPEPPPEEATAPEAGMDDLREIFERLQALERSHAEREAEVRRLQERRAELEKRKAELEARRAALEAEQARLRAEVTAAEAARPAAAAEAGDWWVALGPADLASALEGREVVRIPAGSVVRFQARADDGLLRVRHEGRTYTASADAFAPEPVVRARLAARREAALEAGNEAQARRLDGVLEDLRERLRAAAAADLIPAVEPQPF
jgi:vacuolar-type H+-ATPase subunit I/STV1